MYFTSWGKVTGVKVNGGVVRKLVTGEKAMMVQSQMAPGSLAPPHSHPHEQLLFVGEGLIEVTVRGESELMSVGDVAVIPSNAEHAVRVLSAGGAVVYDIFSPVREDFIKEAHQASTCVKRT